MKEEKKETKDTQENEVKEKKEASPKKTDEKKELLQKITDLEAQLADTKDQMIRHQADLENYKKRLIREKEEAVVFANTKLISDLLQFMDNLERALASAKSGSDIKGLVEGIEMIQSQLLSTLDKNWGLTAIKTEGVEFNPEEHEACMMVVDEKLKTETVLEEFQKGYKLHDRVIRPAKVKVGKPE